MTLAARLFVAALGALLLVVILRALRTHRLRYEYSLLWILLAAGLIVLSAFQRTADQIARWVGIDYPPTFYLLLCLFVALLFLFHLSLRLSVLGDQMKDLAQQIALLTVEPPEGSEDPQGGPEERSPQGEGWPAGTRLQSGPAGSSPAGSGRGSPPTKRAGATEETSEDAGRS